MNDRRMTDKRLAKIEARHDYASKYFCGNEPHPQAHKHRGELLQALKAEREYTKDLTSGIVVDGWIETETRLRKRIKKLEEAHRRNVDSQQRNFKHQEESHRCGWRVMYEAVVARSKEALADDE